MRNVGKAALLAAVGGVIFPMVFGTVVSIAFGYDLAESIFVGTILTATSVTVSAHVLKEMGQLQSRVGSAILGAAIIDDIIGVVVLTIVVSFEGEGSPLDLLRLAAFLPVALVGGSWLIRVTESRLHSMETPEHRYLEVLALVFAFAWAAEEVGGLAAISGAYLAGVLFGRTVLRGDLAEFGNLIGYAMFAPVFFVTTGMSADLGAVAHQPIYTLVLGAVAVLAKVIGCYLGAILGGFSSRESLAVGVGMIARGEVALVIAVLGRQSGVLGEGAFAASIAVTLLTTLVAPLLLRLALPRNEDTSEEPDSAERLRRRALMTQIERLDT